MKINVTHKLSHRIKCVQRKKKKETERVKLTRSNRFNFLSYKMRNRKNVCSYLHWLLLHNFNTHTQMPNHIKIRRNWLRSGSPYLLSIRILTNLSLSFGERFISRIISVSFFCHEIYDKENVTVLLLHFSVWQLQFEKRMVKSSQSVDKPLAGLDTLQWYQAEF